MQQEQFKEKRAEEMIMIEEKRKPLLLELQNEKQKKDHIEVCKRFFAESIQNHYEIFHKENML